MGGWEMEVFKISPTLIPFLPYSVVIEICGYLEISRVLFPFLFQWLTACLLLWQYSSIWARAE